MGKKKTYSVDVRFVGMVVVTIQANSEEEAAAIALDEFEVDGVDAGDLDLTVEFVAEESFPGGEV